MLPNLPPSNPAVWRRWLALELRRLRAEAGLSMQQVADQMTFSKGRLSFLETMERRVRPDDLNALLPLYGVPEEEWPAYYQAATYATAKGWWERQAGREFPEWFSPYVGLEQGAAKLSIYEPLMVHGLFQTPEYAAAALRAGVQPRTEHQIRRIVEARIQRQAVLTRDPDPPNIWLVMSEAGLRHVVGDRAVMRHQLDHLAEAAGLPNVTVLVIPFAHGITVGTGPFMLLDFGGPNDPGIVYFEYSGASHYPEPQDEIDAQKLTFQLLCAQALPAPQSTELVRSIAQEHAND